MSVLDVIFPSRIRRRKLVEDVEAQKAIIRGHMDDLSRTLSIDTNSPEYQRLLRESKHGGA